MKLDKLPKPIIPPIIAAIFCDLFFTLLGQPDSYWNDASKVSEGSPLGVLTLSNSPFTFILFMILYALFIIFLLKKLNFRLALPLGITVALGHIYGSSSWISLLTYKVLGHDKAFLSWYLLIGYLGLWACLFSWVIYKMIKGINETSKR
ncbi:MAG: hypothetical protein Fur003_2370 [Candidatus Dojkabacteria bacterium]